MLNFQVSASLKDFFAKKKSSPVATSKRQLVELPVVYDGLDLERVARLHELTVEQVVQIHATTHHVKLQMLVQPLLRLMLV